jgi:hypothetical protein
MATPNPFGIPIDVPFPVFGQVKDRNGNPVSGLTVSVQNLDKTALPVYTTTTDAGGYYRVTLADWDEDDALAVSVEDDRFGSSNFARKFPYIRSGQTYMKVDLKLGVRQLWEYVINASFEEAVDDVARAEILLDNTEGRWTSGGTATTMGESFKQGDKVEAWLLDVDDLDLVKVFHGYIDQEPKNLRTNYQNRLRIHASSWVRQWKQVRIYDIWENVTSDQIFSDIIKELTSDGTFDGGTDIDAGSTNIVKFVSDGLTVFEIARRLAPIDGHYFGETWERDSSADRKPFFKLISNLTTDPAAVASDKPINWNITNDVGVGTAAPQRATIISLKGGTDASGNQYIVSGADYPTYSSYGLRESRILDQTLFSKADLLKSAYGLVTDESATRIAGKVEIVGDTRDLLQKTWELTISRLGLSGFQVRAKRISRNLNIAHNLRNVVTYDELPLTTPAILGEMQARLIELEAGGQDTIAIPLNLVTQDNTFSAANWAANADGIEFRKSDDTLIAAATNYTEEGVFNTNYAVFTGDLATGAGNGNTIAKVVLVDGGTDRVTFTLPRSIAKTSSKSIQVTMHIYSTA